MFECFFFIGSVLGGNCHNYCDCFGLEFWDGNFAYNKLFSCFKQNDDELKLVDDPKILNVMFIPTSRIYVNEKNFLSRFFLPTPRLRLLFA